MFPANNKNQNLPAKKKSQMSILSKIESPADVKNLREEALVELAKEIRQKIIEVTSKNGGHVSPNLGVVELSIALHRVFNTPKDKILFDVSHQCYTHKLLTGRNKNFDTLRQTDGISGFCNRFESEHDAFGAGHAGTAASAALGLAAARDRLGGDENIIAVLGDAALTNGVTFEAFNNIATTTNRLIIVLNDNKMSIAKNVGAIAQYLNDAVTNPSCNRLYSDLNAFLKKIPLGETVAKLTEKVSSNAKGLIMQSSPFFEYFGIRYLGPIDGHNIPLLEKYLDYCKNSTKPVILHILTQKGRGLEAAVRNPEKFHGASPYDIVTGESLSKDKTVPNYQDVMGQSLVKLAKKDKRVVGITAAMASGTGLSFLKKELPEQFFDVGIAEEHAAVFAAGMACEGFVPVTAIYSTFMQRAFDCAMHDVCLQKLPVVFCLDRAGLSPNDGATHHGVFDIAYLRPLPNAVIMQPANEDELSDMLFTSVKSGKPCFIRYPRGKGEGVKIKEEPALMEIGRAQTLKEGDGKVCVWALGNMLGAALKAYDDVLSKTGAKIGVVNARFVKPLDEDLLKECAAKYDTIVTLEDHVVSGGFGSAVMEALSRNGICKKVVMLGWPDKFIPHGTDVEGIRERFGLGRAQIAEKIADLVR